MLLPSNNHFFDLCIYESVIFFDFLDSTYEWNHTIFVSFFVLFHLVKYPLGLSML